MYMYGLVYIDDIACSAWVCVASHKSLAGGPREGFWVCVPEADKFVAILAKHRGMGLQQQQEGECDDSEETDLFHMIQTDTSPWGLRTGGLWEAR